MSWLNTDSFKAGFISSSCEFLKNNLVNAHDSVGTTKALSSRLELFKELFLSINETKLPSNLSHRMIFTLKGVVYGFNKSAILNAVTSGESLKNLLSGVVAHNAKQGKKFWKGLSQHCLFFKTVVDTLKLGADHSAWLEHCFGASIDSFQGNKSYKKFEETIKLNFSIESISAALSKKAITPLQKLEKLAALTSGVANIGRSMAVQYEQEELALYLGAISAWTAIMKFYLEAKDK